MSRKKWLGLAALLTVLAGVGVWYFASLRPTPPTEWTRQHRVNHDGDAELSDVIEPLWVERGRIEPVPTVRMADEPMARVVLEPGMTQPPRPDLDPNKTLRMPYADEDEILPRTIDPVTRLLQMTRPIIDLFEELNREEQSEARDEETPVSRPEPDYHRMHPHCPYPYRR
jgi:hypothetical protein